MGNQKPKGSDECHIAMHVIDALLESKDKRGERFPPVDFRSCHRDGPMSTEGGDESCEEYARSVGAAPSASRRQPIAQAIVRMLSNLQTSLVQNTTSIVDYCHRYWSGQPMSSSPAESAANSLVNARLNQKRRMRWSLAGAHRTLQVRAAVADGRFMQAKFAHAACPTFFSSEKLPISVASPVADGGFLYDRDCLKTASSAISQ